MKAFVPKRLFDIHQSLTRSLKGKAGEKITICEKSLIIRLLFKGNRKSAHYIKDYFMIFEGIQVIFFL